MPSFGQRAILDRLRDENVPVLIVFGDTLAELRALIVAVADAGTGLFGTGQTTIRATQDLQIISGLPPLVREDDQFRAQLTLRNTTGKAMKVEVAPRATLLTLEPQTVDIPPNEAREVAWNVTAPAQLAWTRSEAARPRHCARAPRVLATRLSLDPSSSTAERTFAPGSSVSRALPTASISKSARGSTPSTTTSTPGASAAYTSCSRT